MPSTAVRTLVVLQILARGLLGLGQADEAPTDRDAAPAPQSPYTFGTTVVDLAGLEGRIYYLETNTAKLPNFKTMHPVGSVYASTLNVWPQRFDQGFPGITERFEWFGIEYTGKIWIQQPGNYRFSLLSDDGARLKLNNKVIIDNDGVHGPGARSASADLTRGEYEISLEYFQGPRFMVALVLAVSAPGEPWRIFDMHDFRPPHDLERTHKGKVSHIELVQH